MEAGSSPPDCRHDVPRIAVGELGPVGNDREDDRSWRLPLTQTGGHFDNRVQQRHPAAAHGEQPSDTLAEPLRAGCVIHEDSRAVGQCDKGDLISHGHLRGEIT